MNITYNGLSDWSNIVTYSDIPNILKVNEDITGKKARLQFTFNDDLQSTVTGDGQYYVTFLDDTITNVMQPSNANAKTFYIAPDNASTAANFARALRNCPSINAAYDITHNDARILLIAKEIGAKWSEYTYIRQFFFTNILPMYLYAQGSDGSADSDLFGGKVSVDIYKGEDEYITTLEKNYYGNECSFNLSPVLATMSNTENLTQYKGNIGLLTSAGEWQSLGSVSGYTAQGYYAANSDYYKFLSNVIPLVNLNNADAILYTYDNTVQYTLMVANSVGGWSTTVTVKNSAGDVIYTTGTTNHTMSGQYLYEKQITIPPQYWGAADRVEIKESNITIAYNVIKPTKATEYYQRICWRNEYGGISFFDFTGKKTEEQSVENTTYTKNVFDFYDATPYREKMIYNNETKKTVSLESHLMKEGGKYAFYSMAKAKDIWEENEDGTINYIIPSAVTVEEDSNFNGIFTGKITYTYSVEK